MKYINLTQGQRAIVDDEDYDWLMQWKWCANWYESTQSFYALRNERVGDKIHLRSMHRQILGLEYGDERQGDHIHHNTLDNRRSQLRIVTRQQNMWNNRRAKGYSFSKHAGKFEAYIAVKRKKIHLGLYDTAEDARRAHLAAKRKYHNVQVPPADKNWRNKQEIEE